MSWTIWTYKVTGNANLKDKVQNSYMTGWSIYLTAGTHTITARMPDYTKGYPAGSDNSTPSFHFRNIYLAKQADAVTPITVALTGANMTTALPALLALLGLFLVYIIFGLGMKQEKQRADEKNNYNS